MKPKEFIEKNRWILLGFFCIGAAALLNNWRAHPAAAESAALPVDSVDTMIPQGYILVPLELENLNSVGSLIGGSGVVDLYTQNPEAGKRRLVAKRVKIIQAPYNPQVYAALVHESEGAVIQNYTGPFRAVVQNPQQQGAHVQQPAKANFSIIYQK